MSPIFGLMLRGGCWLTLGDPEFAQEPIALGAGDCFVIPRGLAYTLRQLLAMETAQQRLGSGLIVSRLADIIFVQAARSAFALRFKEKGVHSPLDYLTRWRMFRAGHLLRNSEKALIEIASSVGCDSGAARPSSAPRRQHDGRG